MPTSSCGVSSIDDRGRNYEPALGEVGAKKPLPVLLEWGTSGGRAGVRSLSQARQVVEEVLSTLASTWQALKDTKARCEVPT